MVYIVAIFVHVLITLHYLIKFNFASKEEAFFISTLSIYVDVLFLLKYPIAYKSALLLMILNTLIVASFVDLKLKLIPNRLNFAMLILGLALVIDSSNILFHMKGFLFTSIFCILIYAISRGNFGGGDVKLLSILGLVLGFYNIFIVLFISFALAFIYGMINVISKKIKIKDPIPFGPYVTIAFIIVAFL